jgi:dienelactone hydrolase
LITGVAAGVPYALHPGEGADSPVVAAWHLVDSPRTERAFAAAVPLDGLDAWRVYFGLPMTGARLPEGGMEELRRRIFADAVLQAYRHIAGGGADEFPAALAAVRKEHGIAGGPIGVLGGSMGGMVAQLVCAESREDVRAAVLVNPVVSLRRTIEALSAMHGMRYTWTPPADAFAARADFLIRAGELAGTAARYITGADDMRETIVEPVSELVAVLHADHRVVAGMGHALAEEPGTDPAPQTPHAAEVDRLATEWFRQHL